MSWVRNFVGVGPNLKARLRQLVVGIYIVGLHLAVSGCNNQADDNDSDAEPHPESYLVDSEERITTEYPVYLYVVGNSQDEQYREIRDIYCGGTLANNDEVDDQVWWYNHALDKGEKADFYNTINSYFNRGNKKFTAGLLFKITGYPQVGTEYNYTIFRGAPGSSYFGTYQKQFKIRAIASRHYRIDYYAQSGYDSFSLGLNLDYTIKKQFAAAGTDVTITSINTALPAAPLDPGDPPEYPGLTEYYERNKGSGVSIFRLMAVSNVTLLDDDVKGVTNRKADANDILINGTSFTFYDRLSLYSGETLQRMLTYVTLHELGHCRGIYAEVEDTSDPTLKRHNGSGKQTCMMLNGVSSSTLTEILNKLNYCSGHQQFFLNQEFLQ